jgi:hypothetical protein
MAHNALRPAKSFYGGSLGFPVMTEEQRTLWSTILIWIATIAVIALIVYLLHGPFW